MAEHISTYDIFKNPSTYDSGKFRKHTSLLLNTIYWLDIDITSKSCSSWFLTDLSVMISRRESNGELSTLRDKEHLLKTGGLVEDLQTQLIMGSNNDR